MRRARKRPAKKRMVAGRSQAAPRIPPRQTVHSENEVADLILGQWGKLRRVRNQSARWYACVIGSLGAAKLIFRMDGNEDGALRFRGDAEVLHFFEDKAKGLADSIVKQMKDAFAADGWLLKVPGMRLEGEREYLTLVREPSVGYRWSRVEIGGDELPPPEFDQQAGMESARHVDRLVMDIVDQLVAARASVAHDQNLALAERISQWIALIGVAKFVLHVLPPKLGAMLEHFGELLSGQIYESITGRRPRDLPESEGG